MRILGLDPGGTTGAAWIQWDGTTPPQPEMLEGYAQVPYAEMPQWFDRQLKTCCPDLVAIERFFISPKTITYTRQPEALYCIGGIEFMCALHEIPTRQRSASSAKNAWDNERLVGWKVKGKHAKDALRHALLATHERGVYIPSQTPDP